MNSHARQAWIVLFAARVCLATLAIVWLARSAFADAVVITKAMSADTIAEFYIEQGEVRVDLDVGPSDFEAFAPLLPEKLLPADLDSEVLSDERVAEFLRTDWIVEADDVALRGELVRREVASRTIRDEITGEPLPFNAGDAVQVANVSLRYRLPRPPRTITFRPELLERVTANIGFVVYHERIAVNDFRYLSRAEKLRLDWEDPWYSSFENRNLRRKYWTPAAAFIYVENFEVRKEVVIRAKDLQRWVDLGLEGVDKIEARQRDNICKKAASFIDGQTPLTIDGKMVQGELDRVHFINRTLRTSGVVGVDEEIRINDALLGVIYVYPIESLPDRVDMEWRLFDDRIAILPTVANDEAGDLPALIDAESPTLTWRNYLTNPTKPAFLEVLPPAEPARFSIPLLSAAFLIVGGLISLRLTRQTDASRAAAWIGGAAAALVLAVVLRNYCVVGIPLPGNTPPPDAKTTQVIAGSLLRNMYSAFDHHGEGRVYDVLMRSVAGDLLSEIYLQTRTSLTLASQGGARVKVKAIEVLECVPKTTSAARKVTANCSWTVTGSVGHWGHIHQRQNLYNAELVLEVVDGEWKLTQLNVLSEERL